MEMFKRSKIFENDECRIKNTLRDKLASLKTESGKEKAKAAAKATMELLEARRAALGKIDLPVSITISVEWRTSRTWGMNPHATGWISNGKKSEKFFGSASGCGYDKLSSVTAQIFNQSELVSALLYRKVRTLNKLLSENNYNTYGLYKWLSFMGGCGIECHRRIFELLGYKWEHHETSNSDYISITKKGGK